MAISQPALGQARVPGELRKAGMFVSTSIEELQTNPDAWINYCHTARTSRQDMLQQDTGGYYACREGDLPPEDYGFELN